jgi:hypothetical protein
MALTLDPLPIRFPFSHFETIAMNLQQAPWTQLRWMEPQSRWMLRTLLRRNLDVMTDSARRTLNWGVLALDIFAVYLLLEWLS